MVTQQAQNALAIQNKKCKSNFVNINLAGHLIDTNRYIQTIIVGTAFSIN